MKPLTYGFLLCVVGAANIHQENTMKLYVLLAMLVDAAEHDPEPDVAIAQIWILITELRNDPMAAMRLPPCGCHTVCHYP